ncbi:MAG TPA: sigma-70 family RNA polymerase sigma factor [Sorangium sp.]|nr:sigma-70 family RNA polymerase sigma factor [Sorangium sp.]
MGRHQWATDGIVEASSALTLSPPSLRAVGQVWRSVVCANDGHSHAPAKPASRPAAAVVKVRQEVTDHASSASDDDAVRAPDALVVRAQRGDTKAFAALFRRHRSAVAAIAYRMLGPNADLEDVVQDVFLQVHRSLPRFRNQAKFSTWLHRVAVNVVLMTRRRAKSRPQYTYDETPRQEPDARVLPDQQLDKLRRQRAFRRLLDKLSDKKRTVFILHELEGMAPADIAKTVGCPVLTVRTRLFYARRELAQLMRQEPALLSLTTPEDNVVPIAATRKNVAPTKGKSS